MKWLSFIYRHTKEIEDLKAKLQLTLNELSKAKSMVEQERGENSELTSRILGLENQLEEVSEATITKSSTIDEVEGRVIELEKLLSQKTATEDELDDQKRKTDKLLDEIDELEAAKIELEDSRDMLEQERKRRTNLERKFQDMELLFEDQKIESENIQQTLTSKVGNLRHSIGSDVGCQSRGCKFETQLCQQSFRQLIKGTVSRVIRLPPYVEKQPVAWKECCVEYWCEKARKHMIR